MANLSSCYGTETIVGNEQAVNEYYNCMSILNSNVEYGFEYVGDPKKVAGKTFEREFFGTGRWSFEGNLGYFNSWYLKPSEWDSDFKKSVKERLRKAVKGIESLIYNFVDYEPGCLVFYKEEFEIRFKDGEIYSMKVLNEENIPLTLNNRILYGMENEDCLDASLDSLMSFDTDVIENKVVRDKFIHLTEDQLEDLAKHLGFSNDNTNVYCTDEDFWYFWGDDISEYLMQNA